MVQTNNNPFKLTTASNCRVIAVLKQGREALVSLGGFDFAPADRKFGGKKAVILIDGGRDSVTNVEINGVAKSHVVEFARGKFAGDKMTSDLRIVLFGKFEQNSQEMVYFHWATKEAYQAAYDKEMARRAEVIEQNKDKKIEMEPYKDVLFQIKDDSGQVVETDYLLQLAYKIWHETAEWPTSWKEGLVWEKFDEAASDFIPFTDDEGKPALPPIVPEPAIKPPPQCLRNVNSGESVLKQEPLGAGAIERALSEAKPIKNMIQLPPQSGSNDTSIPEASSGAASKKKTERRRKVKAA